MKLEEITKDKTLHPPSISVGDEVKVGKFKNRKAEVKGFTKDEHGQPVLKTTKGDQKLFKPRVTKLEPKENSKKLSEITNKERFLNMLKNPEAEKVRQGLEELIDTFRKLDWVFTYELEEERNRYRIRIKPEKPVRITQSMIEDLWELHYKIINAKFPNKLLNNRIMSRMAAVVGFYLIIDD